MSVYNCGLDGNGILYQYSRLRMILNRYTPKVIIYDVHRFDLEEDDHSLYLGWQRRFYDIPGIREVFDEINPMEKYKMYSQLYRYNGNFVQMLSDNFHPMQEVDGAGYKPYFGVMDYEPEISDEQPKPIVWDPLKKKYFEKFYKLCRDKRIVFIVAYSPSYKSKSSSQYQEMTNFCHKYGIPLLDYTHNPEFTENRVYFQDASHLNDTGAREYTKDIVKKISWLELSIYHPQR